MELLLSAEKETKINWCVQKTEVFIGTAIGGKV